MRNCFLVSIIIFFMKSCNAIKTRLVKAIPLSFSHVVGQGVVLAVQGVEISIQSCDSPDGQGGLWVKFRILGF